MPDPIGILPIEEPTAPPTIDRAEHILELQFRIDGLIGIALTAVAEVQEAIVLIRALQDEIERVSVGTTRPAAPAATTDDTE